MTTVKEMIEWLQTLPEDAEVQCGVEMSSGYDHWMAFDPVDIEACDVFDFRDEKYRDNPRVYGRIIVDIRGD